MNLKATLVVAIGIPLVFAGVFAGAVALWIAHGCPNLAAGWQERTTLAFIATHPRKPVLQRWLVDRGMQWSVLSQANGEADEIAIEQSFMPCVSTGDNITVEFDELDRFKSVDVAPYSSGC